MGVAMWFSTARSPRATIIRFAILGHRKKTVAATSTSNPTPAHTIAFLFFVHGIGFEADFMAGIPLPASSIQLKTEPIINNSSFSLIPQAAHSRKQAGARLHNFKRWLSFFSRWLPEKFLALPQPIVILPGHSIYGISS
jgi:hypothetical protein